MLPGLEDRELMFRLRKRRAGEVREILIDNKLHFSAPASLNDESEAQPVIEFTRDASISSPEARSLVKRKMPSASFTRRFNQGNRVITLNKDQSVRERLKRKLTGWFRAMLADSSLCCFLEAPGPTHWAYYGDNNAGLCFVFDRATPFSYTLAPGAHLMHDGRALVMHAKPISYVADDQFPTIDMDRDWTRQIEDDWIVHEIALLTKSDRWAGEKELRVIRPGAPAGSQSFPPSRLLAVILGSKVSADLEAEVVDVMNERAQRTPIYRAQFIPGQFQPIYVLAHGP